MSTFTSLVRKESLQIVRDRRTMLITILMPLMLLLLFGFAISTEVNNIKIVASVSRHTPATRQLLEKLRVNSYFSFEGLAAPGEIDRLLRTGKADAAIVIDTAADGSERHQIIVDASNPTTGRTAAAYITGVIRGADANSSVIIRTLYNPQMKSAYNFVPGIMGMIFILICAIMTSVSIVREKETGTMNLLLVSPVSPRTIIFGKLTPYFIVSCIILAIMLSIAYTVLGLPVSASVWSVTGVTLLYIVLSLAIGLLVSTLASTQVNALIMSAMVFMMPVILLSGMIFPIENMPAPLRYISAIIPARWYIEAMRKLMIQQLPIDYVAREITILAAMTAAILTVAIKKFNTR
ncbi:MAG: ABC transporter permease [Duncaniella sp.]|nr:ABC transporter permease [Duncaniella sp.]